MLIDIKFQIAGREMTAIVYHEPPEPETGFRGSTHIEGIEEADPVEEVALMMEYEDVIWEGIRKKLFEMEYGKSACCR